jgi:hypothetical protein
MSAEPKRYEFTESIAEETPTGRFIYADDPALLEWKRDSEALKWLEKQKMVTVDSVNGEATVQTFVYERGGIYKYDKEFTAPSLRAAIERASSEAGGGK